MTPMLSNTLVAPVIEPGFYARPETRSYGDGTLVSSERPGKREAADRSCDPCIGSACYLLHYRRSKVSCKLIKRQLPYGTKLQLQES